MLSTTDFIHLRYTPDLTEGGVAYICRSLATAYDRIGGSTFEKLRGLVSEVGVELAFRRCLSERVVPFDVHGSTPFTDPDRYDVSLGGHRCEVKSYLVSQRTQISQMRKNSSLLLQAPALIPLEEFTAEGHNDQEIYLFAFLLALVTPSQDELEKAISAGQPVHLIHPMPMEWACPQHWKMLENLVLKSECDHPLGIEIGGLSRDREFITAVYTLPPKQRVLVTQEFYTVAYVHAQSKPWTLSREYSGANRIGIHSPLRGSPYLIPAHGWGNLYVYGMDIWLAGWLTHEEYRRKAHVLPAGSRVFQSGRVHEKNLMVPVNDLRPIGGLLARVKDWKAGQAVAGPEHRSSG